MHRVIELFCSRKKIFLLRFISIKIIHMCLVETKTTSVIAANFKTLYMLPYFF